MEKKPVSLRPHIVLCGDVNAGKSSLMNALTGQESAIVSDVPGTTTDAVSKAMELLPFGAVVFVDTAGLGDRTDLGKKRLSKTAAALAGAEIMLAVVEVGAPLPAFPETEAVTVVAVTQCDRCDEKTAAARVEEIRLRLPAAAAVVAVSSKTGSGIEELKQALISELEKKRSNVAELLDGMTGENKIFVLVCPIDNEAPAGRLILPQVQTVRRILDTHGTAVVVRPEQLPQTAALFGDRIDLVIADSQVIGDCAQMVPSSIKLTTFSVIFSALKGDIRTYIRHAAVLDSLEDEDFILIAEACTHQVHCEDIGRVKLPQMIRKYTGKNPHIEVFGGDYPEDISKYRLIIHCGGCMMTAARMRSRTQQASAAVVPITNYGIAISHMQGVLKRITEIYD